MELFNMKKKFLIITAGAVILFGLCTVWNFQRELRHPQLPVLGQVKPFSLTDSKGQPFYSQQLENKVWIVDFFFTTCSDVCPMMSKHMASLSRSFELVPAVTLVSISVNPDYDSPEVLAKYAKKYEARRVGSATRNKNWYFLTGPYEKIKEISVGTFKLGSVEEPIFHSTYLPLVDRHGLIRGFYDGTDQEAMNKLFKDVAELLKER